MSRLNVENIRHPDAASDSLQLSNAGNVTAPGNLSVTGTSTLTDDLIVDTDTLFVDVSTDRVGVNTASPDTALTVSEANVAVTSQSSNVNIYANDALAADIGGSIGLGATWNGTGGLINYGSIHGKKANATSGNTDGYMSFVVRDNGGTAERARIDSSGRLLVNTTSTIATGTGDKVQVAETVGANILLGRNDTGIDDANNLGQIQFYGNHGGTWRESARIQVTANGGHTVSSRPGKISFQTTTASQNSPSEQMALDGNGDLQFNSGYGSVATAYGCRAWINFDGTAGTIGSGRGSGNVSTVTDNGTGDYTVNFATAMPDANYSVVATGDNTNALIVRLSNNEAVPATGSVRLSTINTSFASADILFCNVAVFR